MRHVSWGALCSLFVVRMASAACPGADCVGGGGPAANDCILTWGGIASAISSCVDGSACDMDGKADGMCTFPLEACLGADPSCGVTGLTSVRVMPATAPTNAALQAAIQSLTPGACTAAGYTVPVKRVGLGPIKQGVVKLRALAVADGKKDPDKLTLTCQPAVPSFANDVQPIFTNHCAIPTCHDSTSASQELILEEGASYDHIVGKPATNPPAGHILIVSPGSIKKSYLARKILGLGLKRIDDQMPQGCPNAPLTGSCPDATDIYTILSWIQGGAPR